MQAAKSMLIVVDGLILIIDLCIFSQGPGHDCEGKSRSSGVKYCT